MKKENSIIDDLNEDLVIEKDIVDDRREQLILISWLWKIKVRNW